MKTCLVTSLAFFSALWACATASSNQTAPQVGATKNRHLSLDNMSRILRSEVSGMLGGAKDPAEAWKELIHLELQRLSQSRSPLRRSVMSLEDFKTPFIVCDVEEGRSGQSRKEQITEYFGITELSCLYNKDEMSCFAILLSAIPLETMPQTLQYVPILPEAKLPNGTLNAIADPDFDIARIESMLCPGPEDSSLMLEELMEFLQEPNDRRSLRVSHFVSSRPYARGEQYQPWHRVLRKDKKKKDCADIFVDATLDTLGDSFLLTIPPDFRGEEWRPCLESIVLDLALKSEICFVGIHENPELFNEVASVIVQGGGTSSTPLYDVGLNGTGQIVALSDTGVDIDNCYFVDSEQITPKTEFKEVEGPANLLARKVVQYVSYADDTDSTSGHGTHVACTIAGRRSDDGQEEISGAGDGIARAAKLAFFDIGAPNGGLSIPLLTTMLLTGYRDAGAKIHSASWGSPRQNSYTSLDHHADSFMYANIDFLFVVAAGNNGRTEKTRSISSPGHNKNGITVGASQSNPPHINNDMLGSGYLAEFSSRGPSDSRRKPDVVAPGVFIESARARPDRQGECDGDGGLTFKAGTSMSTPIVSGTAAIIRQYFEQGWHVDGTVNPSEGFSPRASLVKAVILNGAKKLFGIQDDGTLEVSETSEYDMNQGFGRVDLGALPLKGVNHLKGVFVNSKAISSGEENTYEVRWSQNKDCEEVFGATLTWTDPPASPMCTEACVLNDLDLFVTTESGEMFYPNGLGTADSVNNAERIRIDNPLGGSRYTVHVVGRQLVDIQQYSLVITGCLSETGTEATPQPSLSPSAPPLEECEDTDNSITVRGATQTCDWLSSRTPQFQDFLCNWLDVARACPFTCQECDSDFNFGSVLRTSTSLTGVVRFFGNMFELRALEDISLKAFDVHLYGSETVEIEAWIKPDGGSWFKMCDSSVVSAGRFKTVPIPESDCTPVNLVSGTVSEVYVTLKSFKGIIMIADNEWTYQTDSFTLSHGSAVSYFDTKRVAGYGFDGRIRYNRSCKDSTSLVYISDWFGARKCEWLQRNIDRMQYACEFAHVALHCPVVCGQCVE